jgi:hypothetical protein
LLGQKLRGHIIGPEGFYLMFRFFGERNVALGGLVGGGGVVAEKRDFGFSATGFRDRFVSVSEKQIVDVGLVSIY